MSFLSLPQGIPLEWAANYGFAAIMALMFWRYITNHAKEHTRALRNLEATMKRVEKAINRRENNK